MSNTCKWTLEQFKRWLIAEQNKAEIACNRIEAEDLKNFHFGIFTGYTEVLDQFWRLEND